MHKLTIALAGNPNSGKTAVFNALTGSKQRVGNWPGVTVERKSGYYIYQKNEVEVIDLPGVYTLSSSVNAAIDETIACQFLSNYPVDLIVNVIDGSNLERNLYLSLQLLEMRIPFVLVINMMDIVRQRGVQLDIEYLSKILDCPTIEMIANQKIGIDTLKQAIAQQAQKKQISQVRVPLPELIEQAIKRLQNYTSAHQEKSTAWFALSALEGNALTQHAENSIFLSALTQEISTLQQQLHEDPDIIIADARYRFIHQIAHTAMTFSKISKINISTKIDRIVLNRWLGIPIFLLVMYSLFLFAINIGGAFQDFFDISSDTIFVKGLAHLLQSWQFPPWSIAILADGLGKGINTTVTFIPVLSAMFLFLAFLEDSGYMARAAFVMDKLMNKLGLPGKSFVPMIVGFGCNVPAIMGARTLENQRDRILTVMLMPFMSCSARLAIFTIFATAFFAHGSQDIIFLLYLTGILAAVLTGLLLRKTVLPGKPAALVMELPPYHVPHIHALCRQAWQRLKSFLLRAGKMILPICLLLGMLNAINLHGKLSINKNEISILSATGQLITPLFSPLGIQQDNWPATVGLATGVLAKEVVIGTLNSLYTQTPEENENFNIAQGLEDAALSVPHNLLNLGAAFKNPIVASEAPHDMEQSALGTMVKKFDGMRGAFAYLLFILLYFPCISTLAVMRKEIGKAWASFSMVWSMILAYAISVSFYQCATFIKHPWSSSIWIISLMAFVGLIIFGIRVNWALKNHLSIEMSA